MQEYTVQTLDELDDFDTESVYWDHGDQYVVNVVETSQQLSPVYCFRENGDADGFMGWN